MSDRRPILHAADGTPIIWPKHVLDAAVAAGVREARSPSRAEAVRTLRLYAELCDTVGAIRLHVIAE